MNRLQFALRGPLSAKLGLRGLCCPSRAVALYGPLLPVVEPKHERGDRQHEREARCNQLAGAGGEEGEDHGFASTGTGSSAAFSTVTGCGVSLGLAVVAARSKACFAKADASPCCLPAE